MILDAFRSRFVFVPCFPLLSSEGSEERRIESISPDKRQERMVSFHSSKISWSLVAIVGSLLVVVSAVHFFLTPIFPPSLDYFGARSPSNPSTVGEIHQSSDRDIDFDARFPADSHGAVKYRGAPWKPEIGKWLSGCDSVSKEVSIIEVLLI